MKQQAIIITARYPCRKPVISSDDVSLTSGHFVESEEPVTNVEAIRQEILHAVDRVQNLHDYIHFERAPLD